jgi:hypothetical protein
MTSRNYYVAVNAYRSSTSPGFVNTWDIYRCHSASDQRHILREGLPVSDMVLLGNDGKQSPCYSARGIRLATRSERRWAAENHVDTIYFPTDEIGMWGDRRGDAETY